MFDYKNISPVEIAVKLGLRQGRNRNYHCYNFIGHKNNDNNPSLSISKNAFLCFACGVKGNNIELIKQVLKINKKQAFDWLSDNFNAGGINAQKDNKNVSQARYESQEPKKQKYIDILEVMQAQTFLESNTFTKGLIDLGIEYEHLINWNIGGNSNGETIFYFQDIKNNFINAKRITYNKNLHRNKNILPTYLYKKADGFGQCLYGEHLLDNATFNLPVILVESEKTAIISSYCMPNKIWLASGGANSLTVEKAEVLKGRNVFILVDSDPQGRESAENIKRILEKQRIKNKVIDLFKHEYNGMDLADHLIEQIKDLQIKKSILSDNELELFEEKAGILQYHWNLSRYEAELQALQRIENEVTK